MHHRLRYGLSSEIGVVPPIESRPPRGAALDDFLAAYLLSEMRRRRRRRRRQMQKTERERERVCIKCQHIMVGEKSERNGDDE